MTELQELQNEIDNIKRRNKNVEANKAWETSLSRKIIIALTTYILITLTLFVINNDQPFIHAIIPTLGFLLSTLSLPFIKRFWIKHIYKR